MKKIVAVGSLILLLCSCSTYQGSWLVKFWNGDYSKPKLSEAEKKIFKECAKETDHLPHVTYEERKKATQAHSECEIRKKKELGIK